MRVTTDGDKHRADVVNRRIDMAKRISKTNRWNPKIWAAIERVARANGLSRARFLEMCFRIYQQDAEKMTSDERKVAQAEALRFLESIERGSKE